jgi:IS5 family transposase
MRLRAHDLFAGKVHIGNNLLSYQELLLKSGTAMDAALILAPRLTKNCDDNRDCDLSQINMGCQWYFGMKAHICVNADSRLAHRVDDTASLVIDLTHANTLPHGEDADLYVNADYQDAQRR